VTDDHPAPDLTELDGVHAVERADSVELDTTYFDTPSHALLRASATLCRRTGGDDEGWRLTLPLELPDGGAELRAPAGVGAQHPPDHVLDLVLGWTRGIAVAPVARIQTRRTSWRLTATDGRTLAELVGDRILARPAQLGGEPVRWREWDVELVDGDRDLLDDVEELFATEGVERGEERQRLAHVVGAPPAAVVLPRARKKGPAGLHLHHWLVDQVHELELLDPLARVGAEGGVHGMRKACRRLRAALATYRPLVDRDRTDPIREELRWLARSLGPARDGEVVLERLLDLLASEVPEPGVETARRLLERKAADVAAHEHAQVLAVLRSRRYLDLRTALEQLVAEPPWTRRAEKRADHVLPGLVHADGKRVRHRVRRDRDPHEVRKAAKRLRYAYELLEPAWGKQATRPREAAELMTEVLGDRQDGVAAREWLVTLASEALRTGDSAFTLGRLHALEEVREASQLKAGRRAWRKLNSVRW